MAKDVAGYLAEQQRKSGGDLSQEWTEIEELYNKKLWHQLTLRMQEFVKNPAFATGDAMIKMYQNFIADFEHRINPLALAELSEYVVNQMKNPEEAVEFVGKIQEKVKSNEDAKLLCTTMLGVIYLEQKEMVKAKELITDASAALEGRDGVGPVHRRFYDLASNYHKVTGNHAEYYREALRFLGCVSLSQIPAPEQMDRAFNLSLAAVLGKGVYNFGELLAHDILSSLRGTERQWLVELLYAFNGGNIVQFEQLRPQWTTQPDLANHERQMQQKISLLCLMEMVFRRPANQRQLSFSDIASETRLHVDEVELLVMKALSLGLVKGYIDQVEQKVHMTWVQPRVLDKQQLSVMHTRLQQWCGDVQGMEQFVKENAQDILT